MVGFFGLLTLFTLHKVLAGFIEVYYKIESKERGPLSKVVIECATMPTKVGMIFCWALMTGCSPGGHLAGRKADELSSTLDRGPKDQGGADLQPSICRILQYTIPASKTKPLNFRTIWSRNWIQENKKYPFVISDKTNESFSVSSILI